MAVTTVAQFAAELKSSVTTLLEQLQHAGINKGSDRDPITEADKDRLLDYLRRPHGTAGTDRKKITLTKKSTSEIKQADAPSGARTIQVDIRKKRTFVKHDDTEGKFFSEKSNYMASPVKLDVSSSSVSFGRKTSFLKLPDIQNTAVSDNFLLDRVFPEPFPPDCASAWGDDRFGLWFDLEIGGVTQRIRWIEPGTFWMGSPDKEPGRDSDDGPRHLVTLTEGYWLADTACTQAFWLAVVGGKNPSHFTSDPELPVEQVSWNDITERFLPALQVAVPDLVAALPTEAQWEHACRAGRETAFWFGDTLAKEQANFDGKATVPVKARPANGWGLYQMHGNVWEWCEGSRRKYGAKSVEDPPDGQDSGICALRGGSCSDPAKGARSAFRRETLRDSSFRSRGFRFALRSIKPGQAQPGQGIGAGGAR